MSIIGTTVFKRSSSPEGPQYSAPLNALSKLVYNLATSIFGESSPPPSPRPSTTITSIYRKPPMNPQMGETRETFIHRLPADAGMRFPLNYIKQTRNQYLFFPQNNSTWTEAAVKLLEYFEVQVPPTEDFILDRTNGRVITPR